MGNPASALPPYFIERHSASGPRTRTGRKLIPVTTITVNKSSPPKAKQEIPRLCRGGIRCLTFQGVRLCLVFP